MGAMEAELDGKQPFPTVLTCLAVAPERKATEAVKLDEDLHDNVGAA